MNRNLIAISIGILLIGTLFVGNKVMKYQEQKEVVATLEEEIQLLEAQSVVLNRELSTLLEKKQELEQSVVTIKDDHDMYSLINYWTNHYKLDFSSFKMEKASDPKANVYYTSMEIEGTKKDIINFITFIDHFDQTVYMKQMAAQEVDGKMKVGLQFTWITTTPPK